MDSQNLSGFVRLGDSAYLRDKVTSFPSHQENSSDPSLVLLLSWAGAPIRNVAKYIDGYIKIFPDAPLLLVRTEFSHILRHTPTSQDVALGPVISIIQRYAGERRMHGQLGPVEPRLLVHVFSNGGSYKLIEIAKRYKKMTGNFLPINALYMDSAPGVSSIRRSAKAISYALPKPWYLYLPRLLLIYIGLVVLCAYEAILAKESLMDAMRRHLNEPSLIDRRSKRCYIFSREDDLVGWQDVQSHACLARQTGYDTYEEIFSGSQHVAHARQDPKRYWQIVWDRWIHKREERHA